MANTATIFPPQTYSSTFFLNSVNDDGVDNNAETRGHYFQHKDHHQDHPALLDCFIATMGNKATLKKIHKYAIFLVLSWMASSASAECDDFVAAKVRYFPTLDDYHVNNEGFEPAVAIHKGNVVEFLSDVLSKTGILSNNTFVASGSQYIRKLSLDNQAISVIETGTFNTMSCLRTLDLGTNNIGIISKETFVGLTRQFEILDLSINKLETIQDSTFQLLVGLKQLDLSNNLIQHLYPNSFFNNSLLQTLSLSNNKIKYLLPESLQYFLHLQVLRLDGNALNVLDVDKWRNLTRLQSLNVSHNFLHTFDVGTTPNFANVIEIWLDNNQLYTLNSFGLTKYLPRLLRVSLDGNPWMCEDLEGILKYFDKRVECYGPNVTEPVRHGVACIETTDVPPKPTSSSISSTSSLSITSTSSTTPSVGSTTPTASSHSEDKFGSTVALVSSIEQLQTTVTLLLVVVVCFLIVEVVFRSGIYRRFFKRRNEAVFDVNRAYNETENIALLRS